MLCFSKKIIKNSLILILLINLISGCASSAKKYKLGTLREKDRNLKPLSAQKIAKKVIDSKLNICLRTQNFDGGGISKIILPKKYFKYEKIPALMLDYVFSQGTLNIEVSDPFGARLIALSADEKSANIDFVSNKIKNNFNQLKQKFYINKNSMLVLYDFNLNLTAQELGCLLSFGLPSNWQKYPAKIIHNDKKSHTTWKFKSFNRNISVIVDSSDRNQPTSCVFVKKRRILNAFYPRRLSICYSQALSELLMADQDSFRNLLGIIKFKANHGISLTLNVK